MNEVMNTFQRKALCKVGLVMYFIIIFGFTRSSLFDWLLSWILCEACKLKVGSFTGFNQLLCKWSTQHKMKLAPTSVSLDRSCWGRQDLQSVDYLATCWFFTIISQFEAKLGPVLHVCRDVGYGWQAIFCILTIFHTIDTNSVYSVCIAIVFMWATSAPQHKKVAVLARINMVFARHMDQERIGSDTHCMPHIQDIIHRERSAVNLSMACNILRGHMAMRNTRWRSGGQYTQFLQSEVPLSQKRKLTPYTPWMCVSTAPIW